VPSAIVSKGLVGGAVSLIIPFDIEKTPSTVQMDRVAQICAEEFCFKIATPRKRWSMDWDRLKAEDVLKPPASLRESCDRVEIHFGKRLSSRCAE
jgi:hypothetical protein